MRPVFFKAGMNTQQSQGSILILVLLILSVLVVAVVQGIRDTQVEMAGAYAMHDYYQAETTAFSLLGIARGVLLADGLQDMEEFLERKQSPADHLGEDWHLMWQSAQALNLAKGQLVGGLEDEQGRFPINFIVNYKSKNSSSKRTKNQAQIYRKIFFNLLIGPAFGFDPEADKEKIAGIINCLQDWLDSDDELRGANFEDEEEVQGAESEYYQDLGYTCRNGPILALGELLMIKGITSEIFHGSKGKPGLKDLLTVYGDGKININTASPYVLAAIMKYDDNEQRTIEDNWEFAQKMVEYRQEEMHWDNLYNTQWFNDISGALDINFYPVISVKSSFFCLNANYILGKSECKIYSVLERKMPKTEDNISIDNIKIKYLEIR